ncbi:MAG: tetratricopeptide repeat protein, partial [Bryobacteraceae bacterium]
MKWRRKSLWILAAATVVIAARGELANWVENVESASRLESVFFRSVPLPGGGVLMRRPPKETRPELTKLIAASPSEADLYSLRAREAEEQLDSKAAEADWKRYAALAEDKAAGSLALADFYHRRLRPQEELATLEAAARQPSSASDRLRPPAQQRSWKTFQRMAALIDGQALPAESGLAVYRSWIARYPAEPQAYTRLFVYALAKKRASDAAQAIAAYRKAFPDDIVFSVSATAQLERGEGATDRALASYSTAFQPLWPPELVKKYFDLMRETKSLGSYLAAARRQAAANP